MDIDRDKYSLLTIVKILYENKILVVSIIIFSVGMMFLLSILIKPIYRAEVLVTSIEQGNSTSGISNLVNQLPGLSALTGVNFNLNTNTKDEAIATLRSYGFIQGFIKDEKILKDLYLEKWDQQTNNWKNGEDIPSMWNAVEYFRSKVLLISEDKNTTLIVVAIEWHDREKTANWANLIVERLNEHMRQRAIVEAEKSIDFLRKELEKTGIVQLQQAIYRIIETQISKVMFANVREEYSFKVIDEAVVPDKEAIIRPNTKLLLSLGVILGLMLSVFVTSGIKLLKKSQY